MSKILKVKARQVFDSRGNPTIETEIILVDHNELTQAVTGAAQVNILEVVDHHRLGNPPTDQPILFINRPVGSSCTIIADMYRQSNRIPSAKIAGIMMSGIISDTLKLKGPTSTPLDEDMLVWLAGIANEDIDALATLLGQQSFYLGEQPASVDATVYAFLWQIINAPYASALKDAALNQPNLVAYTQRVSERWFADDPMSVQREVSAT